MKCTKLIPQLVYIIEQYEQQLRVLNKRFNSRVSLTGLINLRLKFFYFKFKINLMENFQAYIRDFKIKLPKNMPITQQTSRINSQSNNEDTTSDTVISTTTNNEEDEIEEEEEEEDDNDDDEEE